MLIRRARPAGGPGIIWGVCSIYKLCITSIATHDDCENVCYNMVNYTSYIIHHTSRTIHITCSVTGVPSNFIYTITRSGFTYTLQDTLHTPAGFSSSSPRQTSRASTRSRQRRPGWTIQPRFITYRNNPSIEQHHIAADLITRQ